MIFKINYPQNPKASLNLAIWKGRFIRLYMKARELTALQYPSASSSFKAAELVPYEPSEMSNKLPNLELKVL